MSETKIQTLVSVPSPPSTGEATEPSIGISLTEPAPYAEMFQAPIYSHERITGALRKSMDIMPKIQGSTELHEYFIARDLDPNNRDTPHYWNTVHAFVSERVDSRKSQMGDSPELDALDLISMVPSFYKSSDNIRQAANNGRKRRQEDLERVSYFNSKLAIFIDKYPETGCTELQQSLATMLNTAFPSSSRASTQQMDELIRSSLTGVRTELAFQQLAKSENITAEPTGVEEDLAGIDYYVVGEGIKFPVDVKSSQRGLGQNSIKGGPNGNQYSIIEGRVRFKPHLPVEAFADNRYYLTSEAVEELGPQLATSLTRAEQDYTSYLGCANALGSLATA